MTFAKRVYTLAGVLGIVVLAPLYFLEDRIGRDFPPAITHPENFYGFIGVALAWQFLFFVIARDPSRFRPAMPVTVLEKLAFGIPVVLLYVGGRVDATVLGAGLADLTFAVLFFLAWRATRDVGVVRGT
ncbi:MAG: hypothetical protein ACTHQM_26520 [Thermoanaerobaculia bacterium]